MFFRPTALPLPLPLPLPPLLLLPTFISHVVPLTLFDSPLVLLVYLPIIQEYRGLFIFSWSEFRTWLPPTSPCISSVDLILPVI